MNDPLVKCQCCYSPKPKTGEPACAGCKHAGCKKDCGNWKRGELCPARFRQSKSARAQRARLSTRLSS